MAATTMCSSVLAQGQAAEEPRTGGRVAMVAADVKQYLLAPIKARGPQWVRFGAAVGAIAFAYQHDEDVRERFHTVSVWPGTEPDTRDGRDAAPALLALGGTWVAARLLDDDDGRREAGSMLEAAALSGAVSYALKELAGRERPYATADRDSFESDGDSFPSLHTTTAFAIGTVLAESGNDRQRWLRRVLGYGLAAATAYARMDHDAHWLSDTVAGAGLGIATARFVMKRRGADPAGSRFALAPAPNGVAIAYTVPLRP